MIAMNILLIIGPEGWERTCKLDQTDLLIYAKFPLSLFTGMS